MSDNDSEVSRAVLPWTYVDAVTIHEAACLLTQWDPTGRGWGGSELPSDAHAMSIAIEQAIMLKRLPSIRAYAYNTELGEIFPISTDDVSDVPRLVHDRTAVLVEDLRNWCDTRGIAHIWSGANSAENLQQSKLNTMPPELRAAIEAFQAVSGNSKLLAGRSPKAALRTWLERHKPELSENARDRIATVANWQSIGGAPKTPNDIPGDSGLG